MHCGGIARYAMIPFNAVTSTPREAEEIIARQREHVNALASKGEIPEGLKAQYELVLQAYESGKAGNLELVAYPKFVIPGSKYCYKCLIDIVSLTSSKWRRKERSISHSLVASITPSAVVLLYVLQDT